MLIRCTAKLLKEMGLSKSDIANSDMENSTLGEWYANLFFIARKKCVIFTNARTLFTFISFDISRQEIRNLAGLFRTGLGRALLDEDFDGVLTQRLVDECRYIQFGRAQNRSVLGVMADHMRSTKWSVEYHGGLANCNTSEIIKRLNRTPLLTQKFSYSIEELGSILGLKIDPRIKVAYDY